MLDSLGVYHLPPAAKKSPVFGYAEEPPNFDQNPDTGYYPPVIKIRNSIKAQYQLKGGAKRLGAKLGGDGINSNTLLFDDDEEILGINGTSATREVCKLMFISRKHNTSNPVMYHGPFGGPCLVEEGKNFSGNVLGFFGSASTTRVAGLGVYIYTTYYTCMHAHLMVLEL